MGESAMSTREQRGLAIVANQKIQKVSDWIWSVPSQSGMGSYGVRLGKTSTCSCPDHTDGGHKCKHIWAVEFSISRRVQEELDDGTVTTTTETVTVTTSAEKKTYRQDWPKYNAAQVNEREHFLSLLADLCSTVKQPAPKNTAKGGRPCLPLRDRLFSACLKVYSGDSARRFSGELQEACEAGFIRQTPHFNSVLNVLDDKETTPVLKDLVRVSALPLSKVETKIAIDSTGFSSCKFVRWTDEKYGQPMKKAVWVKAHCAIGCKTNAILAADVLEQYTGDSLQFSTLAREAAQGFPGLDFVADKAYANTEAFTTADDLGVMLFSPFKSNTTGKIGGIFESMYHLFCLNREAYMAEYHARSNAESTFSAVKRKFGESVKAKNEIAMRNEVYAKFVCYNLTCLIAEMYALGIDPTFGRGGCTKTEAPAQIPQLKA
jgi:hypothetical protein